MAVCESEGQRTATLSLKLHTKKNVPTPNLMRIISSLCFAFVSSLYHLSVCFFFFLFNSLSVLVLLLYGSLCCCCVVLVMWVWVLSIFAVKIVGDRLSPQQNLLAFNVNFYENFSFHRVQFSQAHCLNVAAIGTQHNTIFFCWSRSFEKPAGLASLDQKTESIFLHTWRTPIERSEDVSNNLFKRIYDGL